jgi:septal ring factor EnvC (AmiA/AmiB activator)
LAGLAAILLAVSAQAKPHHDTKPPAPAKSHHGVKPVTAAKTHHIVKPRTASKPPQSVAAPAPAAPEPPIVTDMSRAVPLDQAGKLPSTQDRFNTLKTQIQKNKPIVESARQKNDALNAQAAALRKRLIETAARVQALEAEKGTLDSAIAELVIEERQMSANFARDRIRVARLLGVLERLQHDMPPVIVLKADDALGATHGAMLLGASLPRIYGAAATLSRRLAELRKTRADLLIRRIDSARNAVQLSTARTELDQLLEIKEREAQAATSQYGDLQSQLDTIAGEAADLGGLLAKVAALRAAMPTNQNVVVVSAQAAPSASSLKRGALRRPAVGKMVEGWGDGTGGNLSPGVTFLTQPGASVVSPTDAQVLFSGRYHKTGQVLILEMPGGYDLVLAGLDRVAVRAGDQLLAGEPLGTMPPNRDGARLYFELRQIGKGTSPAPWLDVDLRKAKKS